MRLRLTKSKTVGWIYVGRGAAEGFRNFPLCLRFFILMDVKRLHQGKWIEIACFLPMTARKCS
jgi:hypothetical protein